MALTLPTLTFFIPDKANYHVSGQDKNRGARREPAHEIGTGVGQRAPGGHFQPYDLILA